MYFVLTSCVDDFDDGDILTLEQMREVLIDNGCGFSECIVCSNWDDAAWWSEKILEDIEQKIKTRTQTA
jgi:hypothetical protein